jgi:hypothetical protein
MQRTCPSLDTPEGDTLFDPHLDHLPPAALVGFSMLYGSIVVYTTVDAMYISMLVGWVLLRQPATDWPALSARVLG